MFSKEDYIKYFIQIKNIEKKMRDHFLEYSYKVDDPELRNFFVNLYFQEKAHCKIVDLILKDFGYKEIKDSEKK